MRRSRRRSRNPERRENAKIPRGRDNTQILLVRPKDELVECPGIDLTIPQGIGIASVPAPPRLPPRGPRKPYEGCAFDGLAGCNSSTPSSLQGSHKNRRGIGGFISLQFSPWERTYLEQARSPVLEKSSYEGPTEILKPLSSEHNHLIIPRIGGKSGNCSSRGP